MIIALDGTPLIEPTGGVARYTQELIRALAEGYPEDDYWLVSDQEISLSGTLPPNLRVGARPRGSLGRRWWWLGLNRELAARGVDVFHGTDFAVPYLRRRPSVMTIHDLSAWSDAAWNHGSARVRSRTPRLLRAGLATFVITPTEAIRKAAIEKFHLPPDRVVAVPLAARREFRPVDRAASTAPYFLFVGTLEARKNISRLVDAWRQVHRQFPVGLVLVGSPRKGFAMPVEEAGLRILSGVSDAELPALYSGAVATLYPSHYEGFGLPVLEAMQCGSAVIASRDPAVVEVAGGAAIHVAADDTRALVEAMAGVLRNPSQAIALREAGLKRAAQFSWRNTARRTREVYAAARAAA